MSVFPIGEFAPAEGIAPVAPSPSLLTTARPLGDVDWRTGIAWSPMVGEKSHPWARCSTGGNWYQEAASRSNDPRKADPVGLDVVGTDVFFQYVHMTCTSPFRAQALRDNVEALLVAQGAWSAARALWFGNGLPDDPARQPTLRNTATEVTVANDTLAMAFAELLQAYEDCTGGLGGAVLHVPGMLITAAGSQWLIKLDGALYRGPLGSLVSPGPGYPIGVSNAGLDGFGPGAANNFAGNLATEAWVYVTGPVEYAFGESRLNPPGDTEQWGDPRMNTFDVYAERSGIVRFDPTCVFAAKTSNPAVP